MPRLPINYSKTIIYKIVCNDLNIKDIYVGHTTDFIRRKKEHKSSCNNVKSNKYNYIVYQTIRDNNGWDNFTMLEIEKYPCNDSNEARSRERYYYELLNTSLNMIYPIRTCKEYKQDNKEILKEKNKKYIENNKEKYNIYQKQYRENNREKIAEYKKKYRESKKQK
jgi:hypothetical protein